MICIRFDSYLVRVSSPILSYTRCRLNLASKFLRLSVKLNPRKHPRNHPSPVQNDLGPCIRRVPGQKVTSVVCGWLVVEHSASDYPLKTRSLVSPPTDRWTYVPVGGRKRRVPRPHVSFTSFGPTGNSRLDPDSVVPSQRNIEVGSGSAL